MSDFKLYLIAMGFGALLAILTGFAMVHYIEVW